ncbi:unnamed protein product [Mucor hiemalis]
MNKQDDEAMTHPSVYRDTVNGRACQNVTGGKTCDKTAKANEGPQDNWDLYPNMIRKVENEGSPAQVEHLHELEHTTSN